jgi:hypothetical protein
MDAQLLNHIIQLLQPTYTIVPLQPNQPAIPLFDLSGLGQPSQPNPPVVPRLDMSALNQPNQAEEVHTPQPRLHADQWNTAVSVQVEIDGDVRRIKWFTDLQLAYLSVKDFVGEHPDDSWTLRTFQQTVRIMNERWEADRGDEGFIIAKAEGVKFRAFYEPEENESVRRQPSSQSW